jgi:hypothetical protein
MGSKITSDKGNIKRARKDTGREREVKSRSAYRPELSRQTWRMASCGTSVR